MNLIHLELSKIITQKPLNIQRLSYFQYNGGDEEDRTLDLTDANRTLSQLSYRPIQSALSKMKDPCCGHSDIIA